MRWPAELVRSAKERYAAGLRDEETLVLAHLPFATALGRRLAWQYGRSELEDDFVSAAVVGLVEAAKRFLARADDRPFLPYAQAVMRARVFEEFRAHLVVSMGRETLRVWRKRDFGSGGPEGDAVRAALMPPRSLWERIDEGAEDDPYLADTIADPEVDTELEALAAVERAERAQVFAEALAALTSTYATAIRVNLGLPLPPATIEELADAADHSRQHRARVALAGVFRSGTVDPRRLGYLPQHAVGKQAPGRRVVNMVSGNRRSRRGGPRQHATPAGSVRDGGEDAGAVDAGEAERA